MVKGELIYMESGSYRQCSESKRVSEKDGVAMHVDHEVTGESKSADTAQCMTFDIE